MRSTAAEPTLRAGMTSSEMVARFARLNAMPVQDALEQFVDLTNAVPTLRARAIAARLADEARLRGHVGEDGFADAMFDRWLRGHGLIAHRGVAWERVTTLGRYSRLVLTLAATMRVGTRGALVRLDHDVRRVARDLDGTGSEAAFDHLHHRARAFAHPALPRLQAGVHLHPAGGWRWSEFERFARLLDRHGLRARFGLAEDQCRWSEGTPIVIWNPALAAVPTIEASVASVELRVVARP